MAALLPRRPVAMVAALELPLVLLVAPALLFPTPTRLLVALTVPVTWIAHRALTGRWLPPTPLNLSVFALLAMTAASIFATFDVAFSLGKISGVVLGVLLFWAVTRWTTTAGRLRLATAAFLLAGAGLAVVGLAGTNWMDKLPLIGTIAARLPRFIRGLPGAEGGFQPNAVAGCLILFIPVQIALLAHHWGRSNTDPYTWMDTPAALAVQVGCLAITSGTLALTQSRGAIAGLLVAAIAAGTWLDRRARLLAALAIGVMAVLAVVHGPSRLVELAISRSGSGIAGDVASRTELWSRALMGIQDFPITGMGMNAFRKVLPAAYPLFLTAADVDIAHAHNHILQAALDLGVPGLIAYLALWLGAMGLLIRTYRRRADLFHRALAGGLGAGLIAHFVFGMTDAIPLGAKVGSLLWLTLALLTSLHEVAFRSGDGVG